MSTSDALMQEGTRFQETSIVEFDDVIPTDVSHSKQKEVGRGCRSETTCIEACKQQRYAIRKA